MQYNETELINALNVIQKVCMTYRDNGHSCKNCPLRNCDDGCGLLETREGDEILSPIEWQIKKLDDKPRVLMY